MPCCMCLLFPSKVQSILSGHLRSRLAAAAMATAEALLLAVSSEMVSSILSMSRLLWDV